MPFDAPADWQVFTLGELCEDSGGSIQTGPFGSQLHASDYVPVGIPSVMPKNIGDNRIETEDIARITEEDAERLARHRLVPGDILYSRRGDVRRRALIREQERGWLCGTGCLRVRLGASSLVSPSYLAGFLGASAVGDWIERHAVGATMLNLNTGILAALPVVVPPPDEQQRIADVLASLEEASEAASRLRDRTSDAIRVMFDREVETNGDGWATGALTDLARFVNGKNFTKGAEGTGRPVVRIKELNSGLGPSTVYSERDVPAEHQADFFDLLFPWSGSLGLYRWEGPTGLVNQHIFKVIPQDDFPLWFVEGWLHQHLPEFRAIARDKAVTMGHIQRKHLDEAEVRIPSDEELARLDAVLGPLDALREAKAREAVRIAELRSELLPKLVFGQVRVSEDLPRGDTPETEALVAA